MMGADRWSRGHAAFPPAKLREVNLQIEHGAWLPSGLSSILLTILSGLGGASKEARYMRARAEEVKLKRKLCREYLM
jgi:hypothetical protein